MAIALACFCMIFGAKVFDTYATTFPQGSTASLLSAEEKADIEKRIRLNADYFEAHAGHLDEIKELASRVKNVPWPLKELAENILFNLRETTPGAIDFFTMSNNLGSVQELENRPGPSSGAMRTSPEESWIEWDTGGYVVVSSDRFNIQLPEETTLDAFDQAADIRLRTKTNLFQLTVVDREGGQRGIGPNPDRQELAREHLGLFFRGVPKMKVPYLDYPIRLGLQMGMDKNFNGLVSGVVDIEFIPPK